MHHREAHHQAPTQTVHGTGMNPQTECLLDIFLDGSVNIHRTPEVEHEYNTAVADLLQQNFFHLCKNPGGAPTARGPYHLYLSIQDNRLVMDIRRLVKEQGNYVERIRERVTVPVSPFRRIVKDYFFIVESYYLAAKGINGGPSQLETLDMARRGIHNEGAEILMQVLDPDINVDFDTARRLFTLLCVLHIR